MNLPQNAKRQKKCKRCGFTYYGNDIDIAFRQFSDRHTSQKYFSNICRLCEQDKRTEIVRGNRWKAKARNTRRNHSRSLNIPIGKLESSYGWIVDIMAHDSEHGYANGCSECHESYALMGHKLRDITLDIWDPRVEPSYGSNTRWICSSCNSAKGDMTPEEWAAYKRLWRERDTHLVQQMLISKPEQLEFNWN